MGDIRYSKDHEYVRVEGDTAYMGISKYAQDQLGDVVFVELPESGKALARGDEVAVVESVKAAAEVYAPVGGEVVEANGDLEGNPGLVNQDPEGSAWLIKIKISDAGELESMMDADAYKSYVESLS